MKLLLVTSVDPWVRSVSTIHRYAEVGRALGHDVAIYGEPNPELPHLKFTTDLSAVDLALFVVQVPSDFPDMPHLARVLDGIPREKRVVVDLWGRFNETIRIDHDFNHLEKLDGHSGWEWVEALQGVSDTILQPTLRPARADAGSFLFHGFDPNSVSRRYETPEAAAAAWRSAKPADKPYGVMYVGSNWQRWGDVRRFLEKYAPVRNEVGPLALVGWDWAERPEWAAQKGLAGIDTDPALIKELEVETPHGVKFDEVVPMLGKARFAPVFHRPLFRELGFVTNRSFETFYADALPILMLPREFVAAVYGPAALALVPEGDVGQHMVDALRRPETYFQALWQTRAHLARQHSYQHRFEQLEQLAKDGTAAGGKR